MKLNQQQIQELGRENILRLFQTVVYPEQPINSSHNFAGFHQDPQSIRYTDKSEDLIKTNQEFSLSRNIADFNQDKAKAGINYYTKNELSYCSVGCLLAVFNLGNRQQSCTIGTAFLIQKNIVLTAVQNIYDIQMQKKASAVYFYPIINSKKASKAFIVQECWFPENYLYEGSNNSQQKKESDYAILKIRQNSTALTCGSIEFALNNQELKNKDTDIYGYPIQRYKNCQKHLFRMKTKIDQLGNQNINVVRESQVIQQQQNCKSKTVDIIIPKNNVLKMNIGLQFNQNIKNKINKPTIQIAQECHLSNQMEKYSEKFKKKELF